MILLEQHTYVFSVVSGRFKKSDPVKKAYKLFIKLKIGFFLSEKILLGFSFYIQ